VKAETRELVLNPKYCSPISAVSQVFSDPGSMHSNKRGHFALGNSV
jgi:hypothetical protein